MKIKVKLLYEDAKLPTKAHATDAGFDLYARALEVDKNGALVYGTGVAMAIPDGYVGLVFPRSSIAKYTLTLSNCVGVIGSGYRGEIMAKFRPSLAYRPSFRAKNPDVGALYNIGDRIAQPIVIPIPDVALEVADELPESDRGIGGYGSSGE